MIAGWLGLLAGCSQTLESPGAPLVAGAFPSAIPTASETLLKVSVARDCSGGACTVCGSLFPADGGGDSGALYDPRQPAAAPGPTVRFTAARDERDLVYRSPDAPGPRVISFLLFDGAAACDGASAPVAAASVRIDVSGDKAAAKPAGSADGGAER